MKQAAGTEALKRVRQMRRTSTHAERVLWTVLRVRRLAGLKFRRQVRIQGDINFLGAEARLVVALDGSQHGKAIGYDLQRDRVPARAGHPTLRSWNNQLADELEGVLEAIRATATSRLPSPSRRCAAGPFLSPSGEKL